MALTTTERPEIVFFDIETTRAGQSTYAILEFGAILLCPYTLAVLHTYSKFVRPNDPTQMHNFPDRSNGITRAVIASAGTFAEIADEVYQLLDGRIWAGHNIKEWDVPLIENAFSEINRLAPEPKGILDSLELLKTGFARRAGSMKPANLARHFNLGEQTHRSLDDVLMNFEVLKLCSTVLFLESCLPDIFTDNVWVSPDDIDLENKNTSIPPISVTLEAGSQKKILLLHKNLPLKIYCENLMICYDIKANFTDNHGRPKLKFVVYASERLCHVLDICNSLAEKLSAGCGSDSEWQDVVDTTDLDNLPIVRLRVPFVDNVDIPCLTTQIYYEDDIGTHAVAISTFEARELYPLLVRGNLVDAHFSLDTYDYEEKAGIRLVADKLIVHS